jgi:hypothetical protein
MRSAPSTVRLTQEVLAMLDAGATDEQIDDRLLSYELDGETIEEIFELVHVVLVQRAATRDNSFSQSRRLH